MKEFLNNVPTPIAGVTLGLASLGNLIHNISDIAYYLCGIVSFLFLSLLTLRFIMVPESLKCDLRNPILASVLATFPMASMVLTTYIEPVMHEVAFLLWVVAISLHIALIVLFTVRFMLRIDIEKVYACFFIVYVGIVVTSVTCPAYGMELLGRVAFLFGFVSMIPLYVLMCHRYIKYRERPGPTYPLMCIFAAPISLCIVGYIQSVSDIQVYAVVIAYVFATVFYVLGLLVALRSAFMEFYPSLAALTFPMVISATATRHVFTQLSNEGFAVEMLGHVSNIEMVIAILMVSLVVVRYLVHILSPPHISSSG